jgi:uncharacterized protein YbjT (DUF2867 family)
MLPVLTLATALTPTASSAAPVALVTGATGRTGSLLFQKLKADSAFGEVRALVISIERAKSVLNCSKCDPSEGIFVGNVTDPATLVAATAGVSTVAICVGASPSVSSALQKAIEWTGVQNQVAALASQTSVASKHVLLVSSMGTTSPNPSPGEGGSILFWKEQAESFIMASGVPFTIVKPCGLTSTAGGKHELLVGHDDSLLHTMPPIVTRADVAAVMAYAATHHATTLRFDLCSKVLGPPTTDLGAQEERRVVEGA